MRRVLIGVTAAAWSAGIAWAQGTGEPAAQPEKPAERARADAPPAPGAKAGADTKEEKKPEEKKDVWLAVKGGTVHTVSGAVLEGATVLSRNGKIHAIGRAVPIPPEATVVDATGYRVYPGLVAVESRGILGGEPPEDSTDVFALTMTLGLAGGITTAVTDNTAAKLTYGTLEGMVVKRGLFERLSFGTDNPTNRRKLRESFEKARQHLREVRGFEEKKKAEPDAKPPDEKALDNDTKRALRLLKGEAIGLVNAETAHELTQVAELSEEFGVRLVARGGREAWTVAPRLARADVSVLITPRARVEGSEEQVRATGSSIENGKILHQHGVRFSIIPVGGWLGAGTGISLGGVAGRDLQHLPMEAAFAVRGGLPQQAAVRAITLDAARVLGIDDRVGSIDVGKDADLIVTDGDLLHYMTHVRYAIVNGRLVYDKLKEPLFSHIRPEGGEESPQPPKYWPRRLGEPWPPEGADGGSPGGDGGDGGGGGGGG